MNGRYSRAVSNQERVRHAYGIWSLMNYTAIIFSSELIWINFWFSKLFFYVKNQPNSSKKPFSLKNIKLGEEHLLVTLFDYFFEAIFFLKSRPIFAVPQSI